VLRRLYVNVLLYKDVYCCYFTDGITLSVDALLCIVFFQAEDGIRDSET